jgi:hypothetical protein
MEILMANYVRVNNSKDLEWNIADEHMPALLTFLNSLGRHTALDRYRKIRNDKSKRSNKLQSK